MAPDIAEAGPISLCLQFVKRSGAIEIYADLRQMLGRCLQRCSTGLHASPLHLATKPSSCVGNPWCDTPVDKRQATANSQSRNLRWPASYPKPTPIPNTHQRAGWNEPSNRAPQGERAQPAQILSGARSAGSNGP